MQVVILCGGQGTRIRDVADDVPKPMIPIGDRPILWHIMKGYAQHGFTDFILCLGYKSWAIKRYFLDYHLASADFSVDLSSAGDLQLRAAPCEEPWRVTLTETGLDAMTGCRVRRAAKYLAGDTFLLTYGDGVSDVNIRALVDFHRKQGKIGTVMAVHPPGRFGEIEIEDNRVVDFSEKPAVTLGLISAGFFVFHRSFIDRLPDRADLVLERGPLYDLARDGELAAYIHDGFWHCMDSSRDYHLLNNLWASGAAPWNTWSPRALRRAA
jgi:glucose-1-phosphate cytidylyltransferase